MRTDLVLIVEDEALVALTIEDALLDGGWNVCGIADTAAGALDLARRHRPNLAVLDVRLAGGDDGVALAEALVLLGPIGILFATGNTERRPRPRPRRRRLSLQAVRAELAPRRAPGRPRRRDRPRGRRRHQPRRHPGLRPAAAPDPARKAASMSPVIPVEHPLRQTLADALRREAPPPLTAPARASCLVLLVSPPDRDRLRDALASLATRLGAPPPAADAERWDAELPFGQLLWEWGDGFVRCVVLAPGAGSDPALSALPADWVAALPGETLLALHLDLQEARPGDPVARAALLFPPDGFAGATVADGAAAAFTDFHVRPDGFGRMLVLDRQLTPAAAGRLVLRLLDIETSRTLSLLAASLAAPLAAALDRADTDLGTLRTALLDPAARVPDLSSRLLRLALELDAAAAAVRPRLRRRGVLPRAGPPPPRRAPRDQPLPPSRQSATSSSASSPPPPTAATTSPRRQRDLSRRVADAVALLRLPAGPAGPAPSHPSTGWTVAALLLGLGAAAFVALAAGLKPVLIPALAMPASPVPCRSCFAGPSLQSRCTATVRSAA